MRSAKLASSGKFLLLERSDMNKLLEEVGGGLAGLLVGTIASAINTALTDKVIAARMCNNYVLGDLPEGRYSSMFGKDQNIKAGTNTFSGTVKQ